MSHQLYIQARSYLVVNYSNSLSLLFSILSVSSFAQFAQDLCVNIGCDAFIGYINWREADMIPLNYLYSNFLKNDISAESVVSDLVTAGLTEAIAQEFVEFAYFSVGRVRSDRPTTKIVSC